MPKKLDTLKPLPDPTDSVLIVVESYPSGEKHYHIVVDGEHVTVDPYEDAEDDVFDPALWASDWLEGHYGIKEFRARYLIGAAEQFGAMLWNTKSQEVQIGRWNVEAYLPEKVWKKMRWVWDLDSESVVEVAALFEGSD